MKNANQKLKKRLRKKFIGKLLGTFLLIVMLGFLAGFSTLYTSFASTNSLESCIEVVVKEGDSLWSIASRYNIDNKDIRSIIYKIETINNLSSGHIYPGQVLLVPAIKI